MAPTLLCLVLVAMVCYTQADLNMKVRTIVEKDVSYCIVNGVYHAVGQPFKLSMTGRCIDLTCDRYGNVYPVKEECDDNGVCRPQGFTRREKCLEQRCEKRNNVIGFFTYNEECKYKDQCHAFGVPWFSREGCETLICNKKFTGDGRLVYAVNRVGLQCKDAYGQCRQPGERFVYNYQGVLRSDCYCQIRGDAIYTICG